MRDPEVSVIIPTTDRPELFTAVRSAQAQSDFTVEIIIVYDLASLPVEWPAGGNVRRLCTGGSRGGSHARNLGVSVAEGAFVAFLDDDDEWLPKKLLHQVPVARRIVETGRAPVLSSRVLQRHPGKKPLDRPAPDVLIRSGQAPQDYLFRGRRVTFGRPLLATSTLLTTRKLAADVPWDGSLRRHQDWQWLVDAYRCRDVDLVQVPEATTVYTVGSLGSISATPNWAASLAWARRFAAEWDSRTYADLLTSQVLRYALQARSTRGVAQVVRELVRARTIPSWGSAASAVLGLMPRAVLEIAALTLARIGSGRQERAT